MSAPNITDTELQHNTISLGATLKRQRHRTVVWCIGLTILLFVAMIAGIGIGSVSISLAEVAQVLSRHIIGQPVEMTWSVSTDSIVWEVRTPRMLLAVCVGAGLAVSGMALQAMVRNVLAEPYILGINAGASTGAALSILFGVGLGFAGSMLQITAFAGALGASLAVYGLARVGGRLTSLRLLLSGVAIGYALNALTSFLVFASGDAEGSRSVMFWLLGSLALAGWNVPLLIAFVITVFTVVVLMVLGRKLDVLTIGDDTTQALGISADKLRVMLLLVVSLCTGALVASAGSVGFVGLIVPHLARRAVGTAHRHALPTAALMGAVLLVAADLAARTLLQPQEIPIGILTALVGTPLLVVLIRRFRAGANT